MNTAQYQSRKSRDNAPLFSSSWLALFVVIRENLGRGPAAILFSESPKSQTVPTRH
ncbi:MAG: hypothetical protein R3348_04930 [Xanthomonadales bacterium]|nr:hypothetical protein [Xanthomonadales bacterium]